MNTDTGTSNYCRSCGSAGTGKYCSNCGQSYEVSRITLRGLLHDLFHFFTHLEKGFGYTLKQLLVAPGTMQRRYIEGARSRHQKPISMFILCLTINGVIRYWIFNALMKYYHEGKISQANFYHEYMIILFGALMPLWALLTWLFFKESKYNYAETGVQQLYNFSFIILAAVPITMLKFIWPRLDTAYIELPLYLIYNAITFMNFYNRLNKWRVLIKSVILFFVLFLMVQAMEDLVIGLLERN
jgi:hypothetical protein